MIVEDSSTDVVLSGVCVPSASALDNDRIYSTDVVATLKLTTVVVILDWLVGVAVAKLVLHLMSILEILK